MAANRPDPLAGVDEKVAKDVRSRLAPDETIELAIRGWFGFAIVLTDRRVFQAIGTTVDTWPREAVVGIRCSGRGRLGSVRLQVRDDDERPDNTKTYAFSATRDATLEAAVSIAQGLLAESAGSAATRVRSDREPVAGPTREPRERPAAPAMPDWLRRPANAPTHGDAENAQDDGLERELSRASGRWTSLVVVRTYAADSSGQQQLREETELLGRHGYVPTLQTEQKGRLKTSHLILTGGLGAVVGYARGKGGLHAIGTRTVTFAKVQGR